MFQLVCQNFYQNAISYMRNYKMLEFSQMKMDAATLSELRAICEKGLLLITVTVPEMEV